MEIFVNNLSYEIEENELRDTFAPFGDVRRITVVRDRETGRPRGFGFVDMANPEAAQQAIAALNGKILQGRPLVVSEARARAPAGAREPRPPGSGSSAPPVSGPAPRSWTPQPRPVAPTGLPVIPERRREPGGLDSADGGDSEETELQAQRRRTLARIASFAKPDKRKGDRFEEGKRRVLKGVEKGRRDKVVGDDDDGDEVDDLPPVRIR